MIVMKPPSQPPRKRLFRWRDLMPLALVAFAPKCFLCIGAYLTGASVLFFGPEWCGANNNHWLPLILISISLTLSLIGFRLWRTYYRSRRKM